MTNENTTHFGFKQVATEDKVNLVRGVFDSVAGQYDIMNDLMSLGIHRIWKRIAVQLSNVRKGEQVFDLAGGTGDLTALFEQRVGKEGQVVLADINSEMLRTGRNRLIDRGLVGNIRYAQVNAECLPFEDNTFDCVCIGFGLRNVTDKDAALRSMYRVLKPGGELYFSDVFADRRIPASLRNDPVLLGECLGGAMYWEDFRRMLHDLGCLDVRTIKQSDVTLDDPEVAAKIGMVKFRSVTVRAFKIPLEDRCEDYGQVACYLGTIPEHPHAFDLDDHHHFETGRPLRVCGNSTDMLAESRYAPHFAVWGNKTTHFGLFDCTPGLQGESVAAGGSCC